MDPVQEAHRLLEQLKESTVGHEDRKSLVEQAAAWALLDIAYSLRKANVQQMGQAGR